MLRLVPVKKLSSAEHVVPVSSRRSQRWRAEEAGAAGDEDPLAWGRSGVGSCSVRSCGRCR